MPTPTAPHSSTALLVHFSPAFEIMPGTHGPDAPVDDNDPFTQEPLADSAGG